MKGTLNQRLSGLEGKGMSIPALAGTIARAGVSPLR